MLNSEELKAAFSDEIRIIRHLGTKVDPAQLDWRPSERQRSTIELLRYLTACGIVPIRAMVAGDWNIAGEASKEFADLGFEKFDEAMERQEQEMHAAIDELGDAQLAEREAKLPWGTTEPMGKAIFTTSLRFLCAYRMQLFLYVKQSGAQDLGTANAWIGADAPAG